MSDLRLTAIKCTKKTLFNLLDAIGQAHHRLTKLRISSIDINDFVLMNKLNDTIYNLPQLTELNLSSLKINGKQMADLMWLIYDTCMNMAFLNLSYNILPTQPPYRKKFLDSLIKLVVESEKLVDLDISGMNLRNHVREIMWPLARSKTLQSIHLSDNNINAVTMTHLYLVFGIKD